MSTAAHDSEWIDARSAAKILRVPGARNVHRLASMGKIKTRDLPGVRARFSRADVEHLASQGYDEDRPGWQFNYLFDTLPDSANDAHLARELPYYKNARDRHRAGEKKTSPGNDAFFGSPFQMVQRLGELALRELNRALDQEGERLISAVAGSDESSAEPLDQVRRLWEALARSAAGRAAADAAPGGIGA